LSNGKLFREVKIPLGKERDIRYDFDVNMVTRFREPAVEVPWSRKNACSGGRKPFFAIPGFSGSSHGSRKVASSGF